MTLTYLGDRSLPAYPALPLTERALDLLFPPLCVGCRRVGRWICAHCWPTMPWYLDDAQPAEPGPVEHLVAVARFEGIAREAIHALKYENHFAIARTLAVLMAACVGELDADLVVPVPLHASRRRERGYDQAALLARHLGRQLGLRSKRRLLKRVRKTKQQTTLDAEARRENMRGAFAAAETLTGERILLVDDVFTTGSTMGEAARTLRHAGAGRITGVVFARADRLSIS